MLENNLLSLSYGSIVPKDINTDEGLLPESFESYQIVHPDDIVFRLTDLQNDKRSLRSAICKELGIITSAYLVVRTQGLDSNYLNYLMRSYDVMKVFYSMGGGMRQSIKFDDIKRLPLVVPITLEQFAITSFLDQETSRIDTLISEKERLISLLQEYRQALISNAVTKGLDPSVKMKDSGVEWLGEVPEHWEVKPNRAILILKKDIVGERSSFMVLLSLTLNGVKIRDIESGFGKFPESFNTYQEIKPGDLVFCLFDMDETPRTVGISTLHGMVTGAYSVFHASKSVDPKFIFYCYLRHDFKKSLKPFYTGLRKVIQIERFNGIKTQLPPLLEQQLIASFLDRETSRIDTLISEARKFIDLLKEYRSSLITAAVTGKINVREVVPSGSEKQDIAYE